MNHLRQSDYSIGSMSRADLERIKREADELNKKELAAKRAKYQRLTAAVLTKDPTRLFS